MIVRCPMCDEEKAGSDDEMAQWLVNHKCECKHHWLVPECVSPTSVGKCRKCGAEKELENHEPITHWKRGAR